MKEARVEGEAMHRRLKNSPSWATCMELTSLVERKIAHRSASQNRGARRPHLSGPAARRSANCEMTRRISAVAVCCSSASRCSVNRRAFSIVMTAWAAKPCRSAICLSVKGRTSWR